MERSDFEKLGDRMLFNFVKKISNEVDLDMIENCTDYEFQQAVQDVGKLFSIETNYIDEDYLYNVYKMNENLFNNSTLESKINRPTVKEFEFDWLVTSKEIVVETFRDKVSSYSDDEDEIRSLLYNMRSEGYITPYDGQLINDYVQDSKMEDDELGEINRIS